MIKEILSSGYVFLVILIMGATVVWGTIEVLKTAPSEQSDDMLTGTVSEVVNSNTIVVEFSSSKKIVHIAGTKLLKSAGAEEITAAAAFTQASLLGQAVSLEVDGPAIGEADRLSAFVFLEDGSLFNEALLDQGYLKLDLGFLEKRYDQLKHAEKRAKLKGIGIWASGK